MKNKIKEIIIGDGLGILKFGLFREQVKELFGAPDDVDTYSYSDLPDDVTESWHYDEFELSISFNKEDDWRLVTISISSDFYAFKDFNPIGMEKSELLSNLGRHEINDLEHEDCATEENPTHELFSSDDLGANFWLENNVVTEVQWSPLFIDDETIDWPE